jgi:uncharacterized protein YcbX
MSIIGQVESVWRYPVKSMRGEELPAIFASFAGIYGDRLYAFKSSAASAGFPFFTGRERHEMLLYCPRFRHPEKSAIPSNLAEAEALSPILTILATPSRQTSRWTSRRRPVKCWRSTIRRCCASWPRGPAMAPR